MFLSRIMILDAANAAGSIFKRPSPLGRAVSVSISTGGQALREPVPRFAVPLPSPVPYASPQHTRPWESSARWRDEFLGRATLVPGVAHGCSCCNPLRNRFRDRPFDCPAAAAVFLAVWPAAVNTYAAHVLTQLVDRARVAFGLAAVDVIDGIQCLVAVVAGATSGPQPANEIIGGVGGRQQPALVAGVLDGR